MPPVSSFECDSLVVEVLTAAPMTAGAQGGSWMLDQQLLPLPRSQQQDLKHPRALAPSHPPDFFRANSLASQQAPARVPCGAPVAHGDAAREA